MRSPYGRLRRNMTGLCSNGATAPDCVPEMVPERSSLLAPRRSRHFFSSFRRYLTTWAPQMVDKIWYDWQDRDIRNKLAYGGGSRQATSNFASFITAPNGLSLYVGVSPSTDVECRWSLIHPLLV